MGFERFCSTWDFAPPFDVMGRLRRWGFQQVEMAEAFTVGAPSAKWDPSTGGRYQIPANEGVKGGMEREKVVPCHGPVACGTGLGMEISWCPHDVILLDVVFGFKLGDWNSRGWGVCRVDLRRSDRADLCGQQIGSFPDKES